MYQYDRKDHALVRVYGLDFEPKSVVLSTQTPQQVTVLDGVDLLLDLIHRRHETEKTGEYIPNIDTFLALLLYCLYRCSQPDQRASSPSLVATLGCLHDKHIDRQIAANMRERRSFTTWQESIV